VLDWLRGSSMTAEPPYSLDDPRWQSLSGGYRVPYDASPSLRQALDADDLADFWDEAWNELHHQGDVGEASYAAVPWLVHIYYDRQRAWDFYAFVAVVEECRAASKNPALPAWLEPAYQAAWASLLGMALADLEASEDELLARGALAVVAFAKGLRSYGVVLSAYSGEELQELVRHGA